MGWATVHQLRCVGIHPAHHFTNGERAERQRSSEAPCGVLLREEPSRGACQPQLCSKTTACTTACEHTSWSSSSRGQPSPAPSTRLVGVVDKNVRWARQRSTRRRATSHLGGLCLHAAVALPCPALPCCCQFINLMNKDEAKDLVRSINM